MRRPDIDIRVDGAVRIGLLATEAVWRAQRAPARLIRQAMPLGETAQPRHSASAVDAALGKVLDAAPRRRLFSPRLRIMIADPYLQMAVIRFQQLPRSRGDVELLVTQRFCRDHRLEPAATTIAHVPQGDARGERHVLVCALPAGLEKAVMQSLAARNLHADIVAAESLFTIRAIQRLLPSRPPLLLLLYDDYATIVLWKSPEIISHIGVFQRHGRPKGEFLAALRIRVERYAAILSKQQDRISLHLADWGEDSGAADMFHDLPHPVRDIRRDPALAGLCPSGRPSWASIAEHGG